MSTTFSEVKDYALTNLPGLCIGIESDGSRYSVVNWVAELLRRINYCPQPGDQGDTHQGWTWTLKEPIKDPKQALATYKQFAHAMSGPMLEKVLQHLQTRVATGSGAAPAMVAYVAPEAPPAEDAAIDPDAPLVATIEDAMQINGIKGGNGPLNQPFQKGGGMLRQPVQLGTAVVKDQPVEEALEAVVDRLLAVAELDNEQWGAW